MKVLLLNGSPHEHGCTDAALCEAAGSLAACGVETEIVWIGNGPVRGCAACGGCRKAGRCVFSDDPVNALIEKAAAADGLIVGSPVHYASPAGALIAVLDRLFYAGGAALRHKPAAAVVSARRAGTTASLEVLQKYFLINEMPLVSSQYWCMVHGSNAAEAARDLEGMQIMRQLGRDMAWMLRCIEAGKSAGIEPPEKEAPVRTNFIR